MSIINSVSLFLVKQKLIRERKKLNKEVDNYSCGAFLQDYINPGIKEQEKKVNSLFEQYNTLLEKRKTK